MNRWKVAFFVVLDASVGTNAFWLYSAIDTGISHSYLQAGYNEQGRAIRDLGALIVAGSATTLEPMCCTCSANRRRTPSSLSIRARNSSSRFPSGSPMTASLRSAGSRAVRDMGDTLVLGLS